jgi:hypothetical protein
MLKILKKGQKATISKNIPSVDGMLYKDTKVTIDEIGFPDKDLRVKDDLGKIWYINLSDVMMVE